MSVNKVILVGNVGKDPEVKHFDNNSVASFPLATTERGYTKKDGTKVEDQTEWHNIVVWGGLSKVVEGYVKKGTQLYIEGKIKTRSYDDKDGNKRYVTDILANDLKFVGNKSNTEQKPQPESYSQNEPEPSGDENDDLPF